MRILMLWHQILPNSFLALLIHAGRGLGRRTLARAELAWVDAEHSAVVQFVSLGDAAFLFPPVDVVVHALDAGHGRVASILADVYEPTGHLALGNAEFFALAA